MSVNHRSQIKNLLGGVTATLDDGATAAQIVVYYEGGPENLKYMFYVVDCDAVISVDRPRRRSSNMTTRSIQGRPLRYEAQVPISVMAVDKSTVTATKLLEKIRYSIEDVIETNAEQTTYTVHILRDSPNNQYIGGFDPMWRDDYIIMHKPMDDGIS